MTHIESKTAQVNKPAEQVFEELSHFENFNKVMPESVTRFEADEDSFLFSMKGMPEVRLRLEEKQAPNLIRMRSASSKLDFSLLAHITAISTNTSEIKFEFSGKFNPMVRMMVERPLKNFIETLADRVAQL